MAPGEPGSAAGGSSHADFLFGLRRTKQVGLAPRFDGLRGTEERGGLNTGDRATTGKSNSNGRGRNAIGKFRDDKKIVVASSEKSGVNGSAKILNGNADGVEAILRIANQLVPSVSGIADLMAEIRHRSLLTWLGGVQRGGFANMHADKERVKTKVYILQNDRTGMGTPKKATPTGQESGTNEGASGRRRYPQRPLK